MKVLSEFATDLQSVTEPMRSKDRAMLVADLVAKYFCAMILLGSFSVLFSILACFGNIPLAFAVASGFTIPLAIIAFVVNFLCFLLGIEENVGLVNLTLIVVLSLFSLFAFWILAHVAGMGAIPFA